MAQFASNEAIANTPRSPRFSNSISHSDEFVNKKISTKSNGAQAGAWSQIDEIIESAIDDVLIQYGQGKAHGDVVTVMRDGKQELRQYTGRETDLFSYVRGK